MFWVCLFVFFFLLSEGDLLLSSALGFLLETIKPGLLWGYPRVAPVNPRLADGEHWGGVFASQFAVPLLWPCVPHQYMGERMARSIFTASLQHPVHRCAGQWDAVIPTRDPPSLPCLQGEPELPAQGAAFAMWLSKGGQARQILIKQLPS